MATQIYKCKKKHQLLNNPTAAVVTVDLDFTDKPIETIKLLPGVAIHFTDIESITYDDGDYSADYIGEYHSPENFFLG